jgi:cytidylate kinase
LEDAGVDLVQQDLARRDGLDSSRPVSPLIPAPDAVFLDTSDLTLDQVVAKIIEML